jgi:hypothetical protein
MLNHPKMNELRRKMLRWAAFAAIVHGAIVFVASMISNVFWDRSGAWEAAEFLRIVDLPVIGLIDKLTFGITRLPDSWPFGVQWTGVIVQVCCHGVFGGAVYALLAAATVYVTERLRAKRIV